MSFIRVLNIVQHSHHDIGYTDLPSIAGVVHVRNFADAVARMRATETLPAGERFCWTAEVALPLCSWWKKASEADRADLVRFLRSGQFDAGAMAVHQNGYMNEEEWEWALDYLPRETEGRIRGKTLIQIDVNGLPLGGVMHAAEHGVEQVWMSPNFYMGFTLKPAEQSFFWSLPNGKKVLVWQNDGYNNLDRLFFLREWRRGPIPGYSDLQFRAPDAQDRFSPSEENVRKIHAFFLTQLEALEKSCAAKYPELPVSCTNSYRLDNDPPTPGLPEFVRKWNDLGLMPKLRLTTFSEAIRRVGETGKEIPEYHGSWPDWWANGMPSMPRSCSASRAAKRLSFQLHCPLTAEKALKHPLYQQAIHDLVIFDEHCYCSWSSVSRPWSALSEGALAEKTAYAYRSQAKFEMVRSDLLREKFPMQGEKNSLSLINLGKTEISEYVALRTEALRRPCNAVRDEASGKIFPLIFMPGDKFFVPPENDGCFSCWNTSRVHMDRFPGATALLWAEALKPGEMRRYTLLQCDAEPLKSTCDWEIETNQNGWPDRLVFRPTGKVMLRDGAGAFESLTVAGDFKRNTYTDMFTEKQAELEHSPAQYGAVLCEELPEVLIFRQSFTHPLLRSGERKLEVWKRSPRLRLSCKVDRLSSFDPAVFFVRIPVGKTKEIPRISAGGGFFQPYREQIPDSCRDFFVTDDLLFFKENRIVLGTQDAGLFTLGQPRLLEKLSFPPENPNDVYSIVYHNFWDTNFAGNQNGLMEFRYDLFEPESGEDAEVRDQTRSLASGAVPLVHCRD